MRAAAEMPPGWREAADGAAAPGTSAAHSFRLEAWLDANLDQTAPEAADKVAAACVSLFKRIVASQSHVLAVCRARQAALPGGQAGAPLSATSDAEIAAAAAEGRLPASLAAAGLAGLTGAAPMSPAEAMAQDQAAREALVRPEVVASLARAMRRPHHAVSPALTGAMHAIVEGASAVYPILLSASSAEVEELANAYFKSIYTSQQGIGEVVDMLKRFKASAEARERDIFRCMLHNLFDEYRFFHKYPEKELRITGVLFGQVIQHCLVTGTTLGLALRYVLEALRKQPNTPANAKIYRFGLYALEQFRSRLPKWPQYCAHVVAIRHLRDSQPAFVAEIQAALASGQPTETSMLLVSASDLPLRAYCGSPLPAHPCRRAPPRSSWGRTWASAWRSALTGASCPCLATRRGHSPTTTLQRLPVRRAAHPLASRAAPRCSPLQRHPAARRPVS